MMTNLCMIVPSVIQTTVTVLILIITTILIFMVVDYFEKYVEW